MYLTKYDKIAIEDLKGFIPERVFDAHSHVYREKDLNSTKSGIGLLPNNLNKTDIELNLKNLEAVLGKKPCGGFFMPFPTTDCDIEAANDYLVEQLTGSVDSRGLVLISPTFAEKLTLKYLNNPQIIGFKPYHVFSKSKPTFDSFIEDYIPEWAWEEANKRGLLIILHMVRDKALADIDNQRIIRDKCTKYPNIKLILAHAARGFHAPNTVKGIKSLRGLNNIWFDTSAICEAAPIKAILNEFGPTRILWGSDYPVSQTRGKCITIGDSFLWNTEEIIIWEKLGIQCNFILVIIESLRALKEAADDFGLNEQDIKDIFYNNAQKLFLESKLLVSREKTQDLYKYAKKIIPGGVQLLSKRPEMLAPNLWPAYFIEARGCEVWDLDNKHYYDMSTNGIGSCLLGYRDEAVTKAVVRRINLGSMSTLNPPEEVCLAERLISIHPWAEQVRFARTGGEIAAAAVRIARATTDRSVVAISGYHGWQDWYLAANLGESDALRGHLLSGLEPLGVPVELRNTAVTFRHGNKEEFLKVLKMNEGKLAAVIMEPCRYNDPEDGFLELVRNETKKRGIILIFDEITIGWRLNFGGSHLRFRVNPDIAIFAKALGNGHPMAAVIGTKEAMQGAHSSFISSTYWTESVGPTAALATINKLEKYGVAEYVNMVGRKIINLWRQHGKRNSLPILFDGGYPCLAHFKFNHRLSQHLNTLYVQLMLERGFLAGVSIYPTFAHTDNIIDLYGKAIDEVFGIIADYIKKDIVEEMLKDQVAHTGFGRLL